MEQLRDKDEEYIKAGMKQNDDIDELILSMKEQFINMRTDYQEQLNSIEDAFNAERTKILKRNSEEIAQLFAEHRKLEQDFMNERQQKEDEYTDELEKLKTQDANDQAEQKIKLEKEMQIL